VAQSYDPKAINKKAVKLYDQATEALQNGNTVLAKEFIKQALTIDDGYLEAWLSLSSIYGENKEYDAALNSFKRAIAVDSVFVLHYLLPVATYYGGAGRFDEALAAINRFLELPRLGEGSLKKAHRLKQNYLYALADIREKKRTGYLFNPINLGDSINSASAEYYPSLTINDSVLVYSRRLDGIREDFFKSTLIQNTFSAAAPISGSINIMPSKGAINISQDGEWLVFAGNFPQQGYGNFDIFVSYSTPGGWSEPFNLGSNINSEFWESGPSLSPDKQDLYFSSNRPGGYGGSDIYVSHLQANGRFGPAENMGPNVNTGADELAPFIHADNQTLYFTSNGWPGFGGTDIYFVRKTSTVDWTEPVNLGYPVNTVDNEGSLFVSANSLTAYYASDRADSRGQLDLYKFELPEDVKPYRTLFVKGFVTDSSSGNPLPCLVELINDSTGKVAAKLQTDETGFYFITVAVGKNYTFLVNRKGYLFYSSLVSIPANDADSSFTFNIALQPIAVGKSIVLKNIQFDVNEATLQPVSQIELDRLVDLMLENVSVTVSIEGHTDNSGSADGNLVLSEKRAKAVAAYLAANGIEPRRLAWKGRGSTNPIADNNTAEGRALNRRTEIVITGQ
jgi:outer membrane protein OmpA-like peptidoglycan-associated protein/tetratricopeptide (TPR) repeat protein